MRNIFFFKSKIIEKMELGRPQRELGGSQSQLGEPKRGQCPVISTQVKGASKGHRGADVNVKRSYPSVYESLSFA